MTFPTSEQAGRRWGPSFLWRRRLPWGRRQSLLAVVLVTLLLTLALLRGHALWDHASRLPHPFAGSLEAFFPDVVAVTEWLQSQPIREIAVPDRHRNPYLFHRLCEQLYPVRCRPFSTYPPRPGQWVVVEAGSPLPFPSSPVWKHGRVEVRRVEEGRGDRRREKPS